MKIDRSKPVSIVVAAVMLVGLLNVSGLSADDAALEIEFWQGVKDTSVPEELELFLEQFPNGIFSALAKLRLQRLTTDGPASASGRGELEQFAIPSALPDAAATALVDPDFPIPPAPAARAEGILGVEWRSTDNGVANTSRLNPQEGIEITETVSGGPADEAGLRPRDIILKVGETEVDATNFARTIGAMAPGKVVFVELVRGAERLTVSAEIGDKFQFHWRLAHRGSTRHMRYLATEYQEGRLIARDEREAANWLQRAADAGDIYSIGDLGYLYQSGRGVEQDHTKAVVYLRQAAEAGLPNAMNTLGNHYEMGWGIEKDIGTAMAWYEKAANKGIAIAMYNLGHIYYTYPEFQNELVKGFHWIKQSAKNEVVQAHSLLGQAYENGYGVSQDIKLAEENYQIGADRGEPIAEYQLGLLYFHGKGVSRDRAKAIALMRRSAAQEWPGAIEALNGLRVPLYDPTELQQLLAEAGFDPGPIDGKPGTKTREAISAFQEANGDHPDGQGSLALVAQLRKAVSDAAIVADADEGAELPDLGQLGGLEQLNGQ